MKGFVIVLLCALASVEPRYTAVSPKGGELAALGENPWVVHLRIAVATSGLLKTCAGTLIAPNWVLTSSSCADNARFIWNRLGVVNVPNPSLVIESSQTRINPNLGIAVLPLNRDVDSTDNIAPAKLSPNAELPSEVKFCAFGANEDGNPGVTLKCVNKDLSDINPTRFDDGAGVVKDGELRGVWVADLGFVPIDVEWVNEQTGLSF